MNQGQSTTIVAVVVNDSSNAGVTWGLKGTGSLSNQSKTSATYNAPSTVSSPATATITATSIADSTQSGSIQVTVDPPISIKLSPAGPVTICVNQTQQVTAIVNYDPQNAGVTWSLVQTGSGTLSNETPTSVVYNPVTGITILDKYWTPVGINLVATSVTDPALTAQVSIETDPLLSYDGQFPAATFRQPYSFTLPTPKCGFPPFTWSINGLLPAGLSLNGNVISGIPTYPDSPSPQFGLTVIDSASPVHDSAQSAYNSSIALNLPTVLSILTSSLQQGAVSTSYSQTLQATAGTPPYIWSVSAGALPPGLSIAGITGTISGTPISTGTYNFTAKVTDTATPVPNIATANLSIIVQPKLAIATANLPSGSVATAYAQQVQATGGVPPYTILMPSGSLPAGLDINKGDYSGIIAGVPAATGASNFTVTAEDSVGSTATSNLSIQIDATSCPNNAKLRGNYAFLLSGAGYDSLYNTFGFVGSFIADGAGNVTQGYFDSGSTIAAGTPGILSGSYCISGNNFGTVVLNGWTGLSVPGSLDFEIALQSNGNGNAIIYENVGTTVPIGLALSGALLKQDSSAFSTSKIAGNYAFQMLDSASDAISQAGVFTADGQGNLSGEADFSTLSSPKATNVTLTSNDLSVSSTGRGMLTLNVSGQSPVQAVFYVVNASQLITMENGSSTVYKDELTGQIVQQTGMPYSSSSLTGVSVYGSEAFDAAQAPLVQAGLITWDGAGNFSLNADQDDAGVMSSPAYTGTYTVGSDGRVILSIDGQSQSPVLYLTGTNQGFLVYPLVASGEIWSQLGSSFTDSSFSGTYVGGNWQGVGKATLDVESLTADGSGNITGSSATEAPLAYPLGPLSMLISSAYTLSPGGRGTITQNGSVTGIFYVISPTEIVMIPNANTSPTVSTLSQ